jgi:hypothetical protein
LFTDPDRDLDSCQVKGMPLGKEVSYAKQLQHHIREDSIESYVNSDQSKRPVKKAT